MQQALKPASGAAGAQVVAAELFGEFDVAMDDAVSTLDPGFRGEGLPPPTRDAESWGVSSVVRRQLEHYRSIANLKPSS